jgi:hypothetical protein
MTDRVFNGHVYDYVDIMRTDTETPSGGVPWTISA